MASFFERIKSTTTMHLIKQALNRNSMWDVEESYIVDYVTAALSSKARYGIIDTTINIFHQKCFTLP